MIETVKKAANTGFVFEKENYMIMIAGIAIILVGFLVMLSDKEEYGFGTLGLTVGPIILFIGFLSQFAAIFYKPKK